ncbi:MAG: hypothetical protein AMS16_04415 [Planctomycetes bacterium DG_58]|nr:MAG: hypothetical protein AMS16_04415 [Planctomycetes bacterium DG_58]KPK99375.1 MAG: hypothetical protein AMK75_06585 [Planctomycetes bacterium SM23_65]
MTAFPNIGMPDGTDGDAKVDQALLGEVQHVVDELTKTLKIFYTYPRENTISIKAVDALVKTFGTYLRRHMTLELFVDRHELQWRGVPVYSELDHRKSIAVKLDRDGVRRLVFLEDINREEVVGLLEALTTEIDEESLEDDLVTVLWERQFAHVKVYVLDDFTAEEGFDEDLLVASISEEVPQDVSSTASPEEEGGDASTQEAICAATKAKLPALSEQQTAAVEDMTEKEEAHDISADLSDILFDILQSNTEKQMQDNALKVLTGLVMMHVKGLSFSNAADILGQLRALAADDQLGKELRAEIVGHLQSLADENHMPVIIETLQEYENIDEAEISRFLTMLPAASAPDLCDMMEFPRYDAVVRAALKHLVKDDPAALTSKLAEPNVETAKKILGILESLAEPSLVKALVGPLAAAQIAVKIASIKLLERFKGLQARDLLLTYVAAGDTSLRKAALKALTGFDQVKGPAGPLRQQVRFKGFHNRTLEDKKNLLTTLARLESHHAIAFLEDILDEKRWFEKDSHAETRACAAFALGEIDNDRARTALERHLSESSAAVRIAARLALNRIGKPAAHVGS